MPRTLVTPIADASDRMLALQVWREARSASGRVPGEIRAARVADKLAAGPVALLARYGDHAAGMLVAEPYLEGGHLDPEAGHVSMLFVSPSRWGSGIGGALVRSLQQGEVGPGWRRLSTWTRQDNRRAQRLYVACGFEDTGERASLHEGEVIMRMEWRAP